MPGCRVLDFECNPLTENQLERQREKILKCPILFRDQKYPFNGDLIVRGDGVVDPNLPVLVKVSSMVEVLHMGDSYFLV